MDKACVVGGAGVVGSALARMLFPSCEVSICDLRIPKAEPCRAKFLHVAIPYTEEFHDEVFAEAVSHAADCVIIHSTVPVGTTRTLGPRAVHSPVRGQHDRLEDGLRTFIKYIAGTDAEVTRMAFEHLRGAGFLVAQWPSPEHTELAKLLCSARMLNDLAFYEFAGRVLAKSGFNPDILADWTLTYNQGYAGTKFVRPELDFPMGKVGGTCVRQNTRMLYNQIQDGFLRRAMDLFE